MVVNREWERSIQLAGVALAIFFTRRGGAFAFIPSQSQRDFSRQPSAFVAYRELIILQSAFLEEPLLAVSEKGEKKNDDEDSNNTDTEQRRACYLSLSSLCGKQFVSELQQNQYLVARFNENVCWIENRLASKRCGYSWNDVKQVVGAIHAAVGKNQGDIDSLLGLTELIKILLESISGSSTSNAVGTRYDCNKEIVLACIWHFAESREAHRRGLLDRDFILHKVLLRHDHDHKQDRHHHNYVLSPWGESAAIKVISRNTPMISVVGTNGLSNDSFNRYAAPSADSQILFGALDPAEMLATCPIPAMTLDPSAVSNEGVHFDAWTIARCAARMKRVEVLSQAIGSAALSHHDADHIRCLLLTVEDFDWRALLVRCVSNLNEIRSMQRRTAQTVRTAREGLLVYGPLASMLGFAELKATIEDHAFRFLYPRQYQAVDSIFENTDGSIEAASSFLTSHVQAILRSDEFLQEQVEELLVSSRIKERYSFWKKLIRRKAESRGQSFVQMFRSSKSRQRRWSRTLIDQVPDAVALRVVLRSKTSGVEPPEATQAKEKLLCYYVQEKIRAKWPVWDTRRTKDYVQSPKANRYQSLHYTSSIVLGNDDLPFEVQVRSYDMHLAAEYGSASHSIYKIEVPSNTTTSSLMCQVPLRPSSMMNGYVQSLEGIRATIVGQNTFVFVSIPRQQLNFIMNIKSQKCRVRDAIAVMPLSSSAPSVFVNGKMPQPDDIIENGDALLVLEADDDDTLQGKT